MLLSPNDLRQHLNLEIRFHLFQFRHIGRKRVRDKMARTHSAWLHSQSFSDAAV
jgi:hypothetical protein